MPFFYILICPYDSSSQFLAHALDRLIQFGHSLHHFLILTPGLSLGFQERLHPGAHRFHDSLFILLFFIFIKRHHQADVAFLNHISDKYLRVMHLQCLVHDLRKIIGHPRFGKALSLHLVNIL